MPETALITLLLAGSLLAPAPAHADVNVGLSVAPQTLAAPPHLVAVPGSSVFFAPGAPAAPGVTVRPGSAPGPPAPPPPLVAVPGSSVFFAPGAPRPLFVYRGS